MKSEMTIRWLLCLGVLLAATPVSAVLVHWELQDVAFSDGGYALGSFDYDAQTDDAFNFQISVQGGDDTIFPETTYTDADFDGCLVDWAFECTYYLVQDGLRHLRLTPVSDLDDEGGSIDLNLNAGPGNLECYNCSPWRPIISGRLVGEPTTAESANWSMLKVMYRRN
jgi:hypothetical protein